MGKNNFNQQENQFPQAGIATSKCQELQQSSEKKYSFEQTENSCPLAGMKNLLKNTFPIDGKTVDKWKKLFLLARKTVSPRSKEVTL